MSRPNWKILVIVLILIPSSLLGVEIWPGDDSICLLPLGNDRAADDNTLEHRIIGQYGDHRNSPVRGHKHAGIDLQGMFEETVYSIGKGTVIAIFRNFPHQTIIIRHNEDAGVPFYSVYIHVEDVQVNVGDRVTEHTPIGRLFNPVELALADFGTPPHLHFEIRHNIRDKGEATFTSMSISELHNYCADPLRFFKNIFVRGDQRQYQRLSKGGSYE